MIDTLIVLAKQPRPGHAKTRLTPALSAEDAAAVAAACLQDTLDAVARTPARAHLLAFDADPAPWLPPGWRACAQPQGGLDARLVAAFEAAGHGSALLVGMDTPQLVPADILEFDPGRHAAAMGPARDGGYWALGLRDATTAAAAISGVPMSTAHTGAEQLTRLRGLGLDVHVLGELVDIDTLPDLLDVAARHPGTRLARLASRLGLDVGSPSVAGHRSSIEPAR